MGGVEGRAVLVTGGATAVGRALAIDLAAAVDEVVQRFGRLDGAVNNAGTEAPMALLDADVATFQEVLDVNLVGVFRCLEHEALAMRRQGDGGAIVNVSSVTSGLTAAVGNGLYGTSKDGVDALTKSAGIELAAEGISVNALAFIAADVPAGCSSASSSTSTPRRSRPWPPSPPGGCCRCPTSPPRSGSCSTPRRATWWRRRW